MQYQILTTSKFSSEKIFYVYAHIRLDTNKVFYVGKGKGKRAFSKSSRNKYWHNITRKTKYSVEIIATNLTEKDAFDLEQKTIMNIGMDNLCNMTVGGVSTTGYKHTEETRKLFSEIASNRLENNPEYKKQLAQRIRLLVKSQGVDFRASALKKAHEKVKNLSQEEKLKLAIKKNQWRKDQEKVQAVKVKISLKRDEINEKIRKTLKARPKVSIKRDPIKMQIAQKLGSEALKNPVVINRKLKLNSMSELIEKFGKESYTALARSRQKSLPCTIFNGYFIEDYKPLVHCNVQENIEVYPTDKINPSHSVFVMDSSVLMSSAEICKLLDKTPVCIDWITKVVRTGKNNNCAFGHVWKRATNEDIVVHLLKQLKELENND